MTQTQTENELKRIETKQQLGLPLTFGEKVFWLLYGNCPKLTVAERAKNAGIDLTKARICFGGGTKECLDIEIEKHIVKDGTGRAELCVEIYGLVKYSDGSIQRVHPTWGDYNITAYFDIETAQKIGITQTESELKQIEAKQILSLPLTEYEKALWTLYGTAPANTTTEAQK